MADNLTSIAVVVFQDDDGNEVEMTIIDEFDFNGAHYAALVEAMEPDDGDDEISFFEVTKEGDEEVFDPVEDETLFEKLAELLEGRLLENCPEDTTAGDTNA